ncbi:hypothetical protein [Nocardia huaxiensis]|uniref:Uncharacterized protein n=1 Tax=Nocardia huaxiensis TaxID=2755382 RepID=A0A7D6ZSG6_9NOCA|nr:hypothetical protein [Nocardia huaxiensis]QLY32805.1 hypothetical protein H0264_11605 [Nocardia huaxiensis]UFS93456.1 hypothetical protein LPY97_21770 [Nocardia huaxiensis]
MGQRVPAVVGLYFRESGQWRRIAEFRLTAAGQATFRAVDPVEGLVARVWYHQGVDLLDADRTVHPEDGPEFLRALLQPFGFRDYRFQDDTAVAGHNGNHPAPGGIARATDDSDCSCTEQPQDGDRPAAWRMLDAGIVRF